MKAASDEQIAETIAAARERISRQVQTETEIALGALVEAFRNGRWGSYWCRFPEPAAALRQLTDLSIAALPQLLEFPDAGRLVARLMEVLSEMATVVVAGERTSWERETFQLRELLRVKEDSLRLAVHELRAPVGRIGGYLSMIRDGDFGEISDSTRKVVRQLEDHAAFLRRSRIHLNDLVPSAIESVRAEASFKRIAVDHETKSDFEVNADPHYLRIAIANLLSNSIKYSPEDSTVRVDAARLHGAVDIRIRDEGPGIDAVEAGLIFERYRRGSSTTPGLGLGLYLVRRIVEMHGGQVMVSKEQPKGSSFTIHLPDYGWAGDS
jgi:signal transduction histidine kinase